jgi:hypothetical protein
MVGSLFQVSTSIPRDTPVLRVLFHAGNEATGRRQLLLGRHQRVCVLLHASPGASSRPGDADGDGLAGGPLTATCSPDGQDGVCLAQITVPASWWPPLPPPDSTGRMKPVKVRYAWPIYTLKRLGRRLWKSQAPLPFIFSFSLSLSLFSSERFTTN